MFLRKKVEQGQSTGVKVWSGDAYPASLTQWAVAYADHLADPKQSLPAPPEGLAEEAKYLATVLKANYKYLTQATTARAEAPDPLLVACVEAASPAERSGWGDSFKLLRSKRELEKAALCRSEEFAAILRARGLKPAMGTVIATLLAPVAGILLLMGHPVMGAAVMCALGLAEMIDSPLARLAVNSRRTVLFDQIGDRFSDVLLFGALAVWGFRYDSITGWAAVLVVIAALIGSYVWAMTAALRLKPPEARIGRAERIIAVTFGMLFMPFWPVGSLRLALVVSAVTTLLALSERMINAARSSDADQPGWLGARAEEWAPGEWVPRLVEKVYDENGRLVFVEVHNNSPYGGQCKSSDVVAVMEKRGKQLRIEYFQPSTDPPPDREILERPPALGKSKGLKKATQQKRASGQ
jgi:phosphatidylglycerophosphate synthase